MNNAAHLDELCDTYKFLLHMESSFVYIKKNMLPIFWTGLTEKKTVLTMVLAAQSVRLPAHT